MWGFHDILMITAITYHEILMDSSEHRSDKTWLIRETNTLATW
jgi:hypothetical protein